MIKNEHRKRDEYKRILMAGTLMFASLFEEGTCTNAHTWGSCCNHSPRLNPNKSGVGKQDLSVFSTQEAVCPFTRLIEPNHINGRTPHTQRTSENLEKAGSKISENHKRKAQRTKKVRRTKQEPQQIFQGIEQGAGGEGGGPYHGGGWREPQPSEPSW